MIQAALAGGIMGLLSIPHCMIMCGPFMALSHKGNYPLISMMSQQWARIGTYALLALGFASIGPSWGMRSLISLIAGLIILYSLRPRPTGCGSCHAKGVGLSATKHHPMLLGVIQGLIPCALSATAILAAISMSSNTETMSHMLAFGLMTSLPFTFVHLPIVGRWSKPLLQWLHRYRKAMMGLLALWLIVRAWMGLQQGESMMGHGLSQAFCLPW